MGLSLCASPAFLSEQVIAQPIKTQDTNKDDLYSTHDNYHAFFDIIKDNIAKKDKTAIAAMVKYPLFVQLKGKQVKIKTQKQFIKNYDSIITPKIEEIVKDQQFGGILSTYRGMAFGNGEIWFAGVCQDKNCKGHGKTVMKIIGINNFM